MSLGGIALRVLIVAALLVLWAMVQVIRARLEQRAQDRAVREQLKRWEARQPRY